MKVRNGFVSNSSSSSFIIRDKALEYYTLTNKYGEDYGYTTEYDPNSKPEDINKYCVKLTDIQKQAIERIPEDQKHYDWYMTPFICEDDPSCYFPDEFVIEYADGGHGYPYSEDDYDVISEWKDRYSQVWLLKDHNK